MKDRIQELFDQVMDSPDPLRRFAELVRQDEREACAKLCDEEADQISSDHEAGGMYWCANAIRARSKHD